MKTKLCELCGEEFGVPDYIENYKPRRFCSKRCADQVYLFKRGHDVKEEWKEKARKVNLGKKHPEKSGENHFNWKGGRIKTKRGYIWAYCPDHPFAKYKNKAYVLEHRLVYEQFLREENPGSEFLIKLGEKLYLNPTCVVHHLDNNPSNNEKDNLKGYSNNKEHLGDGKHIELVCRVCGKTYDAKKSAIKGKRGKYCSRKCFNERGRNR